jgi:hypothetical protein
VQFRAKRVRPLGGAVHLCRAACFFTRDRNCHNAPVSLQLKQNNLLIMKKLLMLFFICLFTSSLFAQVKYAEVYKKQLRGVSDPKLIEGNLDFLKSEKNIKIFFDFSQADINGASV